MLVIFLIDCCEILMLFFVKDEYYFIFYNLVFMSFFNSSFFKNVFKKNFFPNFNDFIININIFKKYSFYFMILLFLCLNLIINKKILLIIIINIIYFIYNSEFYLIKILNFIEDFNEYFLNIFFDAFNLNLNRNPDLNYFN
jgi:hypothetical protein